MKARCNWSAVTATNRFPAGNRRASELPLISRLRENARDAIETFRRPPPLSVALAGP
jgi:hypothetical protein